MTRDREIGIEIRGMSEVDEIGKWCKMGEEGSDIDNSFSKDLSLSVNNAINFYTRQSSFMIK